MRASRNIAAGFGSLALVVAGCWALVACGDDGDAGTPGVSDAGTPGVSDTGTTGVTDVPPAVAGAGLELAIGDRFFDPTTLPAAAGETVSVTIVNDGASDHTFTVDDTAVGDTAVDELVPAGERVEVELTVPDGAGVAFYCRFHPEMQGSFTPGVEDAAPTTVASGGGYGY